MSVAYCRFEENGPGRWRCAGCGHVLRESHGRRHRRRCPVAINGDRGKRPAGSCGARVSLAERGWNFLTSTAVWLRHGARRASGAEYAARRAICEACPAGAYRETAAGPVCGACGCVLAWKAARNTRPGASDCPHGHWPALGAEPAAGTEGDREHGS